MANEEWKQIFVPGRVCLFGEHSDWAGGFRRFNSDVSVGATIVVGTNQGVHANVRKNANHLIVRAQTDDGTEQSITIPMNKTDLRNIAREGGFFSYVAGVAYKILTDYQVGGLEIDNYKTDLPTKKGLSSSAAICVLTARAFSALYALKMTVRGEMEYAYQGEIMTPSKCGRMDQGCAYGSRPIIMHYDGEFLDVEEMKVANVPFHYVIVDLKGEKSTTEILKGLQEGYPEAKTDIHRGVQQLLGPLNVDITRRACKAFEQGDQATLGQLMIEAQNNFFKYGTPACPSQLTMPILKKVLGHARLLPHIFGGKGVGSQGDGTAQFLCKSAVDQDAVVAVLKEDFDMPGLKLTVAHGPSVRKALITAAGFCAGNFPATKTVKAELFPIVDQHGVAKPAILLNVEALVAAGIQDIYIIVQQEDIPAFEKLFHQRVSPSNSLSLSTTSATLEDTILEIGHRVHFIVQEKQEGLGHAVLCAKREIGEEAFVLMLGSHLYDSTDESGESCAAQVVKEYGVHGKSVISLQKCHRSQVSRFGCVSGKWKRDLPEDQGFGSDQTLLITSIVEKPTIEYAQAHLTMDGLEDDQFLTVFGQYVLSPKVFSYLESDKRVDGKLLLTPTLDRLCKEDSLVGYIMNGLRYDIRDAASYVDAINHFRNPQTSFRGKVDTPLRQ